MDDKKYLKIEKIAEDQYRTFVPKRIFEEINVPIETMYSPNNASVNILTVMGQQIADALIKEMENNHDPNAENPCEITGMVTAEGVMFVFQFYDEDEIEFDYPDEVDDLVYEQEADVKHEYIVGIFDNMQTCFDFYNKFLYKSKKCKVELIKYHDEYGLYVAAEPEVIDKVEGQIEEFNGYSIYVHRNYFEEKGDIIADTKCFNQLVDKKAI